MAVRPDSAVEPQADDLESLLSGYRPLAGIFDEVMDADGQVRAHWRPFLAMLASLGPEEMNRRFAVADRYLNDSGVFYRVYEDPSGAERPWPLSHTPLIIDPGEWAELRRGLIQRADLLELVLTDAYGEAKLVRDGHLPAALIAGNPEFLRPLVGVAPPGGAHLRFYAVDVGRGADGRWWVLGDRTQAPSGTGFVLESRLALQRAIPEVYRAVRVERLAPFFQAFQSSLSSLNRQHDSRVCLLTPGPMNDSYFEHAYLARYLGLLLVEGEDLTARDDGVFIRTVSGLKRAEVLLRRLDADFCDPLELNAHSQLGVAGLVQTVRDGKVVIANSLGAGLVEARSMLAFLPALAPVLLGAELAIPNIATWWLGHAELRDGMVGRLDKMVIASAFTDNLPGRRIGPAALGAMLDADEQAHFTRAIADRGLDFVLQEAVKLSTMPVWHEGRFEPRPFILRLYLARTGDGWAVMPGGFVRIADGIDAHAVSLQKGGRTADACVLSDRPVAETTLLPTPERIVIQRASGVLPSRAAYNLFWLGRYVERAEATLRLVRALINRITEAGEAAALITARVSAILESWSAGPSDIPRAKPALIAEAVLTRRDCEGSLPRLVAAARSAASVIRDRLSPDAWRAFTDLLTEIDASSGSAASESLMLDRVERALRIIASFSGLAQENMTRLAGWRFLELGRRIERAILTCRFVRDLADPSAPDGALDVLLELCDSQMTYRQRYVMVAARAPVIDLVMLDPNNPRAAIYQLDRIEAHLAALPKYVPDGRLSPAQQIAASIATSLRTADAAQIDADLIVGSENALMKLSETIDSSHLAYTERSEAVWEALA
ncbi:MAG TPA: circularly permuted type 2 ATP-grasp protein [Xanthobacteraceae bacterium]|nr:circularly permuted type 2 ATP-grasp protein [Xanthobacteraceae bacterium]